MSYKIRSNDLAGFDLCALRQPDGTLRMGWDGTGDRLLVFPNAVELLGVVYTLERVEEADPPSTMVWGIYN